MTLHYPEAKEDAVRIARAALPLAAKYNLPANPVNYAVLYEFVAGQNVALVEAMQAALGPDDRLTADQARELYCTHIIHTDTLAVESYQKALKVLVESAGRSLNSLDGNSVEYEKHLHSAAEQLKAGEPSGQVRGVVDNLIQGTESMRQSSQALRDELSQSQKELEDLRSEYTKVRKEALLDPLTGLQNRRAFDSSLAELAGQSRREESPLALLLLDIDHFKKVNDTFGHIVGDTVLKWFAKIAKDTVKGTDYVARYGGEEFSVLLPATGLPGAKIAAENIRQRVCEQKLRVGPHQVGIITCSVGVACLGATDDLETLIANADKALYDAKASGRNKVCLHGNH